MGKVKGWSKIARTHVMWFLTVMVVAIMVYIFTERNEHSSRQSNKVCGGVFNVHDRPQELTVNFAQDPTDVLKNVYAPPLRYNDREFRQLGYLKSDEYDSRLPLFGRQIDRHDRWTYYTMDGALKLPIEHDKRKCTESLGCYSLSDKDEVSVDGAKFKVTMYDTNVIGY